MYILEASELLCMIDIFCLLRDTDSACFEVRHPCCVNVITNLIMHNIYSQNTTIFSVSSIIDIQLH